MYISTPCAITIRVTSLHHKSLDYSMKNNSIIVFISTMNNKIFYCLGALLGKQFDVNFSHTCIYYGLRKMKII